MERRTDIQPWLQGVQVLTPLALLLVLLLLLALLLPVAHMYAQREPSFLEAFQAGLVQRVQLG